MFSSTSTAGVYSLAQNAQSLSLGTAAVDTFTGYYQFGGACNFSLDQVLNYTEFTSLYDRYKIRKIVVKIIPECNVASTAGTSLLPVVGVVRDYDDNTVPTSTTQLAEMQGYREYRLNRPLTFAVYPRIANTVWQGTLANGYSVMRPPWLDNSSFSVPHYGLKFFFRNVPLSGTAPFLIRFTMTYHFACKDTR